MNIQQAIKAVIAKQNLNEDQMHDVMNSIMTGQTTDAQIGAFLVGLAMKGETIKEITASAKVMRSLATPVEISNSDIWLIRVELAVTAWDCLISLPHLPLLLPQREERSPSTAIDRSLQNQAALTS